MKFSFLIRQSLRVFLVPIPACEYHLRALGAMPFRSFKLILQIFIFVEVILEIL